MTTNDYFIMELLAERRADDRDAFFQDFSRAFLKTDSPMSAAQTMLQADSPEGAALKFIQNEEQMERLLELARQRNLTRAES